MIIEKKLAELGIVLPQLKEPIANFMTYVRSGNLLYLSGQGPLGTGMESYKGKLGADISNEIGYEAARISAINLIAALKEALGDLDKVSRIVSVHGYVNCTDDFIEQPNIINGTSDLLVEVFGEKGKHTRCALGVNALPMGICVEVELVAEIID